MFINCDAILETMPPKSEKAKSRMRLTISQKIELLQKLDDGWTVAQVCEEFGVKKQTVSDIKKAKEQLRSHARKHSETGTVDTTNVGSIKSIKAAGHTNHDEAVFRWFEQQRSVGVAVRGHEIKMAAVTFADKMKIKDFKASDGWLYRFRKRHGLKDTKLSGEAASAPTDEIEPFRQKINKIIDEEGLVLAQVYNFDETGLFWKSLPINTQEHLKKKNVHGVKQDKVRISAMCFANADGTHALKPCIVGKAQRPRAIKDIMHSLPVHYYAQGKAWFTAAILKSYLFDHAFNEIRRFQEDVLKIHPQRVRAVILMDHCPAHPDEESLMTEDGRIRCIFLPKNTTSLIQPMDQGIIYACKRLYRSNFLKDVLVVLPDEEEEVEEIDTRGQKTLQNIKAYNIRSAIFNWAAAWSSMKQSTFANAWKHLLNGSAADQDFGGFENEHDFNNHITRAGLPTDEDDVDNWLSVDEGDPGHQLLTEEEIIAEVEGDEMLEEDDDDNEAQGSASAPSLSSVRDSIDNIISFVESTSHVDLNVYYTAFREFRHKICNLQFKGRQTSLDTFFRPRSRIEAQEEASTTPAKKAKIVPYDEDESSGGTVIPSSSPLWDASASPPPLTRSLTSMTSPSPGPSGLQGLQDDVDDE